jgi:hypothetical protein
MFTVVLSAVFRISQLAVSKRVYVAQTSNGNDIETKAEQSFDLDFIFDTEAKRTCLFQNL